MASNPPEGSERIPVIQEEAHVIKREVVLEQVRVHTGVERESVTVRDTIDRDRIEVRRVAIGREVAEAPAVREEDGITVVPVIEERLVVEKRLFLIEEIHLVRHRSTEEVAIPVELRRTVIEIERSAPESSQEETV